MYIIYLEMAENIVNDSWPMIITWCNPEKNFCTQLSGIDFTPINISIKDQSSYVYLLSQLFQLFSSNAFSLNYVNKITAIKFWQCVTLTIHNSNSIVVTEFGLYLILHMLESTSHRLYFEVKITLITVVIIVETKIYILFYRYWRIFMQYCLI